MVLESFSVEIFLKAILRVFPALLLLKTPEEINISFYTKFFLSLVLSISLYSRLMNDQVEATHYFYDFIIGLAVAIFLSLFFSAALNFSYFFSKAYETSSNDSWKSLLDAFAFIVLVLFLAHLKIERSILNILVSANVDENFFSRVLSVDFMSKFLKEVCILGLKVSGFGFVFVLSKKLFDEIYLRIGGESMRIVFTFLFFVLLLSVSPLLIPSVGHFFVGVLSNFWKVWMGG